MTSRDTSGPASNAKRDAIVSAASDSFFSKGYAATAIEHVAAVAGVSKVTVYSHFGDKRALFTATVERECANIRGYFNIDALPEGTLEQRLQAIGEAMIAFLSRDRMTQFERRIAPETVEEPGIGTAFLDAGPHRMTAAFADWIAAMCERGELAVDDAPLAAEQFASLCKGMGDLERRFGMPNDPVRNAERIAGAVHVFLAAYGTGAARP